MKKQKSKAKGASNFLNIFNLGDFNYCKNKSKSKSPLNFFVNDTQVKIYAWYDNEWGYANRLVDIVNMVIKAT